ncbi:Actin- protein 8 [Quaeritorhiza haematococci]|nr:Actin- protein 8 [Quaeritorhiza haematococci]
MVHGLGHLLRERIESIMNRVETGVAIFGYARQQTGGATAGAAPIDAAGSTASGTTAATSAAAGATGGSGSGISVRIIQSPREIDPRFLVWKGGSVFAKLDMTQELWIGLGEWEAGGPARLAGKSLFAWD